jgi:osmotically-inducible protein OsmY
MAILMRLAAAAVVEVCTQVGPKEPAKRDGQAQLAGEVKRALLAAGYAALRHVIVFTSEGCIVLRGTVPSFHVKQVAQEIAMRTVKVEAVSNQLDVGDGEVSVGGRRSTDHRGQAT